MTERCRNHPTVLLEKAFSMGVALLFMYLVTGNGMIEMLAAYTAVFVAGMVYSFAIWRRTWVSFEDTEIVVLRDTWVTKKTKRIQYSRLASVGVARSIINRICGTTRLIFNVNSSINANEPEATLTVDSELAERIRRELNSRIFSKESETAEEPEIETLVKVSNADIVIHAFISQPTARLVFAVLMLVYSFVSILYDSAGGLVIPLLLLAANEIIPLAKEIFTYCNYRLYRVGDTITVESGLLSTVRMSFKVGKVNSVRMRQPLLARALGMCVLEAEVVGIAVAGDDAGTPLLCPLKKEAEVRGLMAKVMPEVVFEPESISQSRGAFMAMAVTNLLYICLAISVTVFFAVFVHPVIGETDGIDSALILVTEVFVAIGIPLLLVGHVIMAQRNRRFAMGPESFLLVYGGYDTMSEFILYDKVQYTSVDSGPIQRTFGNATLHVSMMSSQGFRETVSGLFPPRDLERVPAEVMGRIRDGRYDHRRYE